MNSLPLVIIGSGLAGYMLAKEWRKLDAKTPLIIVTADDGAFYSKPLLSTALAQQKTPEQLMVNSAEIMAQELNAQIICQATVTAIDPIANTLQFNSHNSGALPGGSVHLEFSQLVLACGAEAIIPQLTGDAVQAPGVPAEENLPSTASSPTFRAIGSADAQDKNRKPLPLCSTARAVQTVNNLGDYRHFRQWLSDKKQLAILGAGLVGCEFANDLVNAGYSVTVIAPDAHPLSIVLPTVVGQLLQNNLAAQGVNWRLGRLAVAVNHRGRQIAITLDDNQEVIVDGVFSAVGLRPQVDLARRASIIVNRGIVVNRWHQTNFSHIFALGDCAEVDGLVQMYVAPLLQSARALAKVLTGGREPVHYPVMPIVVKTPALPLVFSAPPAHLFGEWRVEGEGHHLRALFHDSSGQLRGFVLAGDKIRDKMPLAKQLPLVFSE